MPAKRKATEKKSTKKTEVTKKVASVKTSKRVKEIQASIVNQFADGLCKILNAKPKKLSEGISWGCPSFNLICTGNPFIGLIPGRIYEVFGPNASGKTTLGYTAIAECQAVGGVAAFVDAEHSLDPRYARKIGVQLHNLLLTQPDYGEQGLEVVDAYIRSGVNLVIVDSVAALTPRSEIEGEMGDYPMGGQARLMSQAMRKLTAIISKSKAIVIFINQTRHKFGSKFENPEVTCAGNALKFYASIRMRCYISFAKTERILGVDKKRIGSLMTVECVKNKIHSPFLKDSVTIYYGLGLDRIGDLYKVALKEGLIGKSNRRGVFNIPKIGRISDLLKYAPSIENLVREHFDKKIESGD
jgi:recombination protein RecA